jgi:hypothetical protein
MLELGLLVSRCVLRYPHNDETNTIKLGINSVTKQLFLNSIDFKYLHQSDCIWVLSFTKQTNQPTNQPTI